MREATTAEATTAEATTAEATTAEATTATAEPGKADSDFPNAAIRQAYETWERAGQFATKTVQERPGASLAVAAILGAAVGWFWKRK